MLRRFVAPRTNCVHTTDPDRIRVPTSNQRPALSSTHKPACHFKGSFCKIHLRFTLPTSKKYQTHPVHLTLRLPECFQRNVFSFLSRALSFCPPAPASWSTTCILFCRNYTSPFIPRFRPHLYLSLPPTSNFASHYRKDTDHKRNGYGSHSLRNPNHTQPEP